MLWKPTDTIWTNNGNIGFIWSDVIDVSEITNYNIQIDDDSLFGSLLVDQIETDTNHAGVLGEGDWYWRVRAKDAAGNNGEWSTTNLIRIDTSTPTISGMMPPHNDIPPQTNVNFNWTVADISGANDSGVFSNWLEIDTNGDLNADVVYGFAGAATGQIHTFSGDATNRWRIVVQDIAGNSTSSGWSNVVIVTSIPIATLYYPIGGNKTNSLRPPFFWSRTASGDTNRIQISSSSSNFGTVDVDTNVLGSVTNIIPLKDLTEGTNWWRVITHRIGTSTWYTSTVAMFVIDTTGPPAVTALSPSTNWQTNSNIEFIWNSVSDVSGISNYLVQIDDDPDFSSPVTSILLGGTITNTNISVGDGKWFWRVIASDKLGNPGMTNSVTNKLYVDAAPPAVNLNTLTTIYSPDNITFAWDASDPGVGMTNCVLVISNKRTGSVIRKTNVVGTNINNYHGSFTTNLTYDNYQWSVTVFDKQFNRVTKVINDFVIRQYDVQLSDIKATDSIREITINNTAVKEKLAYNAGKITLNFEMSGKDVNTGSVVYLVYAFDREPTSADQKLKAIWINGTTLEVEIPSAVLEGNNGKVLYFKVEVDNHLIDNPQGDNNSWGFSLGEIKEQDECVTILNNVPSKTGDDRILIVYCVEATVHVNVSVYTINGELVRTIVDDVHEPDIYTKEWDVKNINGSPIGKGLYFMIVKRGDGQPIIRKILIIK